MTEEMDDLPATTALVDLRSEHPLKLLARLVELRVAQETASLASVCGGAGTEPACGRRSRKLRCDAGHPTRGRHTTERLNPALSPHSLHQGRTNVRGLALSLTPTLY